MIYVHQVKEQDPFEFKVTVKGGGTETHHHVTMCSADYLKWTQGKTGTCRCIEAAFEFLLDHEPKESILSRFDVSVISTYFPGFEAELPKYL